MTQPQQNQEPQPGPAEWRRAMLQAGATTAVVMGETRRMMVWSPLDRMADVLEAGEICGLRFQFRQSKPTEIFLVFNF